MRTEGDIADRVGGDLTIFRRALRKMVVEGQLKREGTGTRGGAYKYYNPETYTARNAGGTKDPVIHAEVRFRREAAAQGAEERKREREFRFTSFTRFTGRLPARVSGR